MYISINLSVLMHTIVHIKKKKKTYSLLSACVSKVPWGTLLATLVVCLGVGLFCGAGHRATEIVNEGIFRGLFKFYVEW